MAPIGLRGLYDRVEDLVTPVANELTRSEEFARFSTLLGKATKGVRTEVDKLSARAWHALNLPAGTDVQRLRNQVGALDREIRLLAMELERAPKEARSDGSGARAEHG